MMFKIYSLTPHIERNITKYTADIITSFSDQFSSFKEKQGSSLSTAYHSYTFDEIYKEDLNSKKTLTDNGAIAYHTSGKELLDFNFNVSSMRFEEDESSIVDEFIKVYAEDPKTAIKYLFFVGDIRVQLLLVNRKAWSTSFFHKNLI